MSSALFMALSMPKFGPKLEWMPWSLSKKKALAGLLKGRRHRCRPRGGPGRKERIPATWDHFNKGTIKSATMLMILIKGFTAGPAVSL